MDNNRGDTEMILWTRKVCRKCKAINPGDTVVCIKPGCSCRKFNKEMPR